MAQLAFIRAYRAERARPRRTTQRTPLLVHAGRLLGRLLPTWDALRRFVLVVAGLATVCAGCFQLATAAGWIAVGVSFLILEYLTGGGEQ